MHCVPDIVFCYVWGGEQWWKAFLSLCATFKRAVITTKEERHACFWHLAIINLSQDSFELTALNSFLTWITTFAHLVIVFAVLQAKRILVQYEIPFLWVSTYVVQRHSWFKAKTIPIFHTRIMLYNIVVIYFILLSNLMFFTDSIHFFSFM